MPELPEVETVRLTLAPLVGRQITEVWTSGKPLRLGQVVDRRAHRRLRGHRVEGLRRLGKYLLIDVDGQARSILVHLGMSGRLRLVSRTEPHAPHTHVVWKLDDRDPRELRFSDPRRFGQVDLLTRGHEREHPALAHLGPDPLAEVLSGADVYERARATKRAVKLLLLDQRAMAGVGNIYASEALFEAGIHPLTPSHRLSRSRCERLAAAIRQVLEFALDKGGTSLRDFVDADGAAGENADYLRVYDRESTPCPRAGCDGTVRRRVVQGRATFYCPSCQVR